MLFPILMMPFLFYPFNKKLKEEMKVIRNF